MLNGNKAGVEALKLELDELGNMFAEENNVRAVTFVYVLLRMADHILVPQTESLQVNPASCVL